ncbi:MAG: thioredoxin family protein [Erysipelotrichaceae bacterium]|nr:thioredoxin family protein [Erysipelotrichaceae bacterium]
MKKLIILLMMMIMICGCSEQPANRDDAIRFKNEYEALNGQSTASGNIYREIEINEDNPFVYSSAEEIVAMMQKGESFIVYFGANWCPWCRSILPSFIEVCHEKKMDTVYYVDVRPDNDPEKEIRDVYSVDESGRIYLSHEGSEGYHRFIKLAANVLAEYSREDVKTLDGTEFAGAKRVGAPNFVIVKDGKAVKMELLIPESLSDPYMKLNDNVIRDIKRETEVFLSE